MSPIDVTIIVLYLLGTMAIGLAFRGKTDNAADYFTANGSMSGWFGSALVGLSIASAYFSGITFVAYPAVIYGNGLLLFLGTVLFALPVSFVVLRYWFLPRYLAAGCRSPYDIVERAFGPHARTLTSSLFVLMRIGWMAATIYAPTLVIMAMGGLDDRWFWPLVIAQGLTSTVYTLFAGVRGVVITDAIQMVVIAGSILATIVLALMLLPVSLGTAWHDLVDSGRLITVNTAIDPTQNMTLWVILVGVTFGGLSNYVGDQMSLQRYLATGNARSAGHSFIVNILGVAVVLILLSVIGLALRAYYAHVPDPTLPLRAGGVVDADKVFPHFVATNLPIGLAGLLAAAIMAASSLTPGINTLSSVLTLDFRLRLGGPMTDAQQVRFARLMSLLIGVAATLVTGVVSKLGTLYDLTQTILGVFAGPLLAVVTMATMGLRLRGPAVIAGIGVGCATGIYLALGTKAASLLVCPITCLTTAAVAIALHPLMPARKPTRELDVEVAPTAT